jgi:hypothetical protein
MHLVINQIDLFPKNENQRALILVLKAVSIINPVVSVYSEPFVNCTPYDKIEYT